MASGQYESISIQPFGIGRVDLKILTEKYGSDFRSSEGKTQMSGTACVNCVNGQASCLIGGLLKIVLVLHC
jgi:hypothetical protein